MYIKCETFEEWLKYAGNGPSVSPGGMAREFGLTRQGINYLINNDVINAYIYEGQEGKFVIIPMSEYEKMENRKK